jgi:hippurate hydrolase
MIDAELHARLTAWRRHLHAHPELTLHEKETAAYVCERLKELGIPFQAGIGGHGVVATLSRGESNRSVGLRADMDALAIEEATGLGYASSNAGVMHACGHDGHTTSLLGAAALLARDPEWRGTVHFVFQPAEEGGGGARSMIEDGLFERFPMERIFGYHNWPGLEAGAVQVHPGPVMASGGRIELRVHGRSGHAAIPHEARDPMVAAAHLLIALQSIISRETSPLDSAVISLCTIEAGHAVNQIPDEAVMRGTFRTLSSEVREALTGQIQRVAGGIGAAFGVEVETIIRPGYGVTANTAAEANLAAEASAAAGLKVRRDLAPSMTGEDFSYYLAEKPGAFVWIGNGDTAGLHNSKYDYNDAILPAASTYLVATAKRALAG